MVPVVLLILSITLIVLWRKNQKLKSQLEREILTRRLQEEEIKILRHEDQAVKDRRLEFEQEFNHILKRTLSHDLISPFTVMLCYLDLLQEKKISEGEVDKILERSRENLTFGLGLIQNVKNLFTTEARVKNEILSLHTLDEILSRLDVNSELKAKDLRFSVKNETCDPLLLHPQSFVEGILKPLLDNAIKYSLMGGVIELKAWEDQGQMKISLRDYGMGLISPHRIRAGSSGEIGHGLSLMRARIHLFCLEGSLQISNQEPGTEVLLTLPLRPASRTQEASHQNH